MTPLEQSNLRETQHNRGSHTLSASLLSPPNWKEFRIINCDHLIQLCFCEDDFHRCWSIRWWTHLCIVDNSRVFWVPPSCNSDTSLPCLTAFTAILYAAVQASCLARLVQLLMDDLFTGDLSRIDCRFSNHWWFSCNPHVRWTPTIVIMDSFNPYKLPKIKK